MYDENYTYMFNSNAATKYSKLAIQNQNKKKKKFFLCLRPLNESETIVLAL